MPVAVLSRKLVFTTPHLWRLSFCVSLVYAVGMAKRRVNLYLDGEVYDRVKNMCDRLGNELTASSIANQALTLFDAHFTPAFEKAIAGDKDAALQLIQGIGINSLGELSNMLSTVHTDLAESTAKRRAT